MKFSPYSIKSQQFAKSLRGYDTEEVQTFLEKLSDEVEQIQNENAELKKQLESSMERVRHYKKIEMSLQKALLNAQENSDKAIENTKKQSALMIKESEIKASQILEKAKQEADIIRESVLKLREEKNLLVARIKAIIETQAEILSTNEANITSAPVSTEHALIKTNQEIDVDEILEDLL